MDQDEQGVWLGVRLVWVVGILVVTLIFPGGAAAQRAYPTSYSSASASATAIYWTPEMMAAAIPLDTAVSGVPTSPAEAPVSSGPPGAAGAAGGSMPGQPANQGPGLLGVPSDEAPIPADGPFGVPGPHDTYAYGPKYRTYPLSTVGKLFFTEPGVGGFVCTATVTTGGSSQNVIWTAGHCVAKGDGVTFWTNFLFCPSYDASQGGVNPAVGCWAGLLASTSNEWFNNGPGAGWPRDYAIIVLASSGTVWATDVANVTGSLGFGWNWARDQHWFHYGYPSGSPYSGGQLIATATEHRYDDPAFGSPFPNSWGSGQTPGASGSALILFFKYGCGGGCPLINSNVSYYYDAQKGMEFQGPYFDTQVCNFWKSWTGYGGAC